MTDQAEQHAESVARWWCPNCDERGLPTANDGAVCLLCGEEACEEFRPGWDESD